MSYFVSITFGGACAVSALISSHFADQLNELFKSKTKFENNIVTSDKLDNVDIGSRFILQHHVPNVKKYYSIISISADRTGRSFEDVMTPYVFMNNYTGEINYVYKKTFVERDIIYRNLEKIVIPHQHFGLDGLTCLDEKNVKLILPFNSVTTISGNYGVIREMMKSDYYYLLELSNVGTVFANIFDCVNKTLYFGAEKVGTQIIYDIIGSSPHDVSDHEFHDKIEFASTMFVIGGIISCTFAALTVINMLK